MAYKINATFKDALKLAGGGIVGAGVALLFAPRSGKETRRDIVQFARTAGRKTDRAAHDLGVTLADFASTVDKTASGLLHEGREMTKEARRKLLKAVEK